LNILFVLYFRIDIVACRRSVPLEKLLHTLPVYLPLISNKTFSKDLFDAYREILIYFDSKLTTSTYFTYSEQQLLSYSQQIFFFIHINPNLEPLLTSLPHLVHLIQRKTLASNQQGQCQHQPLKLHSSVGTDSSTSTTLLTYSSSECSQTDALPKPSARHDVNDSGVELRENGLSNVSLSNHHHPQQKQATFVNRSHPKSLVSSDETKNQHPLVTESFSSPATVGRTPLKLYLTDPSHSMYTNYRSNNILNQSLKLTTTLTKSNEEEQVLINGINNPLTTDIKRDDSTINTSNVNEPTKLARPFYSLHQRTMDLTRPVDCVSPYLDVDGNLMPVRNTFLLANTGMKGKKAC
jgi:hypothetical protein